MRLKLFLSVIVALTILAFGAAVMADEAAMKALMSIEGFRNLNQDIETIINKSEAVKKARKEKNDEEITKEEKKELTEEEKEYKTKRKQIQEKLIKFAERTNIPVATTLLSKSVINERHE